MGVYSFKKYLAKFFASITVHKMTSSEGDPVILVSAVEPVDKIKQQTHGFLQSVRVSINEKTKTVDVYYGPTLLFSSTLADVELFKKIQAGVQQKVDEVTAEVKKNVAPPDYYKPSNLDSEFPVYVEDSTNQVFASIIREGLAEETAVEDIPLVVARKLILPYRWKPIKKVRMLRNVKEPAKVQQINPWKSIAPQG